MLNNTPALNETQQSITQLAQAAGLNIVRQSRIGKNASDSELLSEANAAAHLRRRGRLPPDVAGQLHQAGHQRPGPGLQPDLHGARASPTGSTSWPRPAARPSAPAKFFSPFPQLDVIDKLDPDYQKSYQKYNGGKGDDIGLAEWGLSKVVGAMLQAAGKDLSRQSFLARPRERQGVRHQRLSGRELQRHHPLRGQVVAPAGGRLQQPEIQDHRPVHHRLLGPRRHAEHPRQPIGADRHGHRRGRWPAVMVAAGQKQALVIGVITGAGYGLVALGLVLIYKSSGVFNFAQGEFGTVAVYALYRAHDKIGHPADPGHDHRPGRVGGHGAGHRAARSSGRCSTPPGSRCWWPRPASRCWPSRWSCGWARPGPAPSSRPWAGWTACRCSTSRCPTSGCWCWPRWCCWPCCWRCSSPGRTSAWPSSASARSRWPPS